MNRLGGLLIAGVVLQSALPSFAAVQEITSNDEYLRLYGSSNNVSVVTSNWNTAGGGLTGFSGAVYRTYVTKGNIPISDDRFIEIIAESRVDERFTNKVSAAKTTTNVVGWSSLTASVAGLVGALVFGSNDNPNLALMSLLVSTIGLGGVVVAASMETTRPFSDEEAYAAIQAYNKRLDERLKRTP